MLRRCGEDKLMLRVGLTGGLGSGKSTVAAIFRSLGVHVIEADAIGRALMQPGQQVYKEIVAHFGEGILLAADAEGHRHLDRGALAKIVFDNGRIEELNAIVHPAVIAAQAQWMDEIAAREPDGIAMVESALIFETKYGGDAQAAVEGDSEDREIAAAVSTTGWQTRFDRILLVTAREDVKIARYVQRAGAGRTLSGAERAALQDDARRRLAAQIADEVKSPLCDYVIENNGDQAALEPAVRRVFAALKSSAAALARQTR
jgi:dephospho-CoA kinase